MDIDPTTWLPRLREGAAGLGIALSTEQEALFARFLALLLAKNEVVNLTAITDPAEVAAKHFVDSLTVETVWKPQPGDQVIDIGTGAGFPGVPMAILHPEVKVILNDSVRKKTDFLADAITALPLPQARAVWARAEELGRSSHHRGRYNAVFARAVAHLGMLIEYALPLLKIGGVLIAMKGPTGAAEVPESDRALAQLCGAVKQVRTLSVPGAGERTLIVVRKVKPTSDTYPRTAAQMQTKPLHFLK
jgi:16S rRNA (guanine527-N7)-methyltransferase